MNAAEINIKNSYKQHRFRVKAAKAMIDNSPPMLHVVNFARLSKLKEDVATFIARHQQNARLLVALNKVARTKGEVDSFRTQRIAHSQPYSRLPDMNRWLDQVDMENLKIGRMILDAKPELDSWLNDKFLRKSVKKKTDCFKYPSLVMSKYSPIELPSDPLQLQMLLRPKIWFHLEIKDVRPLGFITMELYTEAAPQIVMEFVRLCHEKDKDRIHFIRLFPYLWLEGNILLDDQTLVESNIEYDKRSIDHNEYAGVLSFNVKNVYCSAKSIINFAISFKPLNACNGRRVGFGRICRGLKVLKSIEDYGNKNGKAYKDIIVSSCGIVNYI